MFKNHYENVMSFDFVTNGKTVTNAHDITKLEKIVVHMSIHHNPNALAAAYSFLELVGGQKPRIHKSKKAVALWRLKKGDVVGLSLNLRKDKAYSFLEKLVMVVFAQQRPKNKQWQSFLYNKKQGGQCTVSLKNLRGFPEMEPVFEMLQEENLTISFVFYKKNSASPHSGSSDKAFSKKFSNSSKIT